MFSNDTRQNDKVERFFSISFGIVSIVSVLVCLIGMIFCCVSFIYTSWKSSEEYSKILQEISTIASSDNSQGISGNASSSLSSSTSSETLSDKSDVTESLIKHMENMVTIQKNGMTNDLMSFIYGMLSTLLVGLCAGFVVKSRANADDAKNTVNEAKKNAEIAKEHAEIAAEKAKGTEEAISKANNAAIAASILKYQFRFIVISSRILTAKASLLAFDKVSANQVFTQIRNEIELLFTDDKFVSSLDSNDIIIELEKVYDELRGLQGCIKTFKDSCREKYRDNALESMMVAADNYKTWMELAIQIIDSAKVKGS